GRRRPGGIEGTQEHEYLWSGRTGHNAQDSVVRAICGYPVRVERQQLPGVPLDGLFDCRLTFDIRCVAAGVRKREVLDFEKGVSEKGLEHEGSREVRGERNATDH